VSTTQEGHTADFSNNITNLRVTVESKGFLLAIKTVAAGNGALGKSSLGPIPLYLDISSKDVTVTPENPIAWTMTLESASVERLASQNEVSAKSDLAAPSQSVRYFSAAEVQKSFSTAGTLFRAAGMQYQIITGRHDKPAGAEVHILDTDVMYVVQGSATYITGGTVMGAHTTAENEIRGESIEGGDSHELSKGDIIVVPAGTPHWFKAVEGEFLYYLIKVRLSRQE
jgi:mannose-6-phosphate isomerase-like protein (cupin superfamily)